MFTLFNERKFYGKKQSISRRTKTLKTLLIYKLSQKLLLFRQNLSKNANNFFVTSQGDVLIFCNNM